MLVEDSIKRCTGCQQVLPLSEFRKNRWAWSGYEFRCKACKAKPHAVAAREQRTMLLAGGKRRCTKCRRIKALANLLGADAPLMGLTFDANAARGGLQNSGLDTPKRISSAVPHRSTRRGAENGIGPIQITGVRITGRWIRSASRLSADKHEQMTLRNIGRGIDFAMPETMIGFASACASAAARRGAARYLHTPRSFAAYRALGGRCWIWASPRLLRSREAGHSRRC